MIQEVEIETDAFGAGVAEVLKKHGYTNFMLAGIQDGTGQAMCMTQVPSVEKALLIVTLLMMQHPEVFELVYKAMMGSYMKRVAGSIMPDGEVPGAPVSDPDFVKGVKF